MQLNSKSKFITQYNEICDFLKKDEITKAIKAFHALLSTKNYEIIKFFSIL